MKALKLTLMIGAMAAAAVPVLAGNGPVEFLSYQGRLQENGQPVNGVRSISLSICGHPTGGVCEASTGDPQSVEVVNGLFHSTHALNGNWTDSLNTNGLLSQASWYLRIDVGGTELTPRELLTYSAYAVYARTANELLAPEGEIGVLVGTTAFVLGGVMVAPNLQIDGTPDIKVDGSLYLSAAEFAGDLSDNAATGDVVIRSTPSLPSGKRLIISHQDPVGGIVFETGNPQQPRMGIDGSGRVTVAAPSALSTFTVAGGFALTKAQAAGATAGAGLLVFDEATNTFKVSENGGAFTPLMGQGAWTVSAGDAYRSSGFVGVGTTSPLTEFHVASFSPGFMMMETDGTANNKVWRTEVDANSMEFQTRTDVNGAGEVWLKTTRSGTAVQAVQFPVNASVPVGIGTSAPGKHFDVQQPVLTGSASMRVKNTDATATFQNDAVLEIETSNDVGDPMLKFITTGSDWVVGVDRNGGAGLEFAEAGDLSGTPVLYLEPGTKNVGIGTAAPGSQFDVARAFSGSQMRASLRNTDGTATMQSDAVFEITTSNDTGDPKLVFDTTGTDFVVGIDRSQTFQALQINPFALSASPVFAVNNLNRVGVGTLTPDAKLGVVNTFTSTPGLAIRQPASATTHYFLVGSEDGKVPLAVDFLERVGVGTDYPSASLHVAADDLGNDMAFMVSTGTANDQWLLKLSTWGVLALGKQDPQPPQPGDSEHTRLQVDGNIQIDNGSLRMGNGGLGWGPAAYLAAVTDDSGGNDRSIKFGVDAESAGFGGETRSTLFVSSIGAVAVSTENPRATFHVTNVDGYSGDLLMATTGPVDTGAADVFRVTGEGKVYANNFIGDGSGLTGVSATASPAGADTQVQFNNAGSLGADAEFTYVSGTNRLGIGTITPGGNLDVFANDGTSTLVYVRQLGAGDSAVTMTAGAGLFTFGVDNSDGDRFKISNNGILGATDRITIQPGGGIALGSPSSIGADLHVYDAAGGDVSILSDNGATGATADAVLRSRVASDAAGDPMVLFTVPSTQEWALGVDNSVAGNPFKLGAGLNLGTGGDFMEVDNTGRFAFGRNFPITLDSTFTFRGSMALAEGGAPTVSAGYGILYFDSASKRMMISENGNSFQNLVTPQTWLDSGTDFWATNREIGIGTDNAQNARLQVRPLNVDQYVVRVSSQDGSDVWALLPSGEMAFANGEDITWGGASDVMLRATTGGSRNLQVLMGGAEALRVNTDMRVGVGEANPLAHLHVNANDVSDSLALMVSTGTNQDQWLMKLSTWGVLAIGQDDPKPFDPTSDPGTYVRLQLDGSMSMNNGGLRMDAASASNQNTGYFGWGPAAYIVAQRDQNSDVGLYFGFDDDANASNPATRLFISSAGLNGFNTENPRAVVHVSSGVGGASGDMILVSTGTQDLWAVTAGGDMDMLGRIAMFGADSHIAMADANGHNAAGEGEFWYDGTANTLKYYDGTTAHTLATVAGVLSNPMSSTLNINAVPALGTTDTNQWGIEVSTNFRVIAGSVSITAGNLAVGSMGGFDVSAEFDRPGNPVIMISKNKNNTDGASHALVVAETYLNGGDPMFAASIDNGGEAYLFGIDQSDAQKFKLSSSQNLELAERTALVITTAGYTGIGTADPKGLFHVGTSSLVVNADGFLGVGTSAPAADLDLSKDKSAATTELRIENKAAAAGSAARLYVGVEGIATASGKNPMATFAVPGGTSWTMGVDNSASDAFVLETGFNLGTAPRFVVGSGGEVGIGTASPVTIAALTLGSSVSGSGGETLLQMRGGSAASQNVTIRMQQMAAAGEDLEMIFATSGGTPWSIGMDKSDSGKFKFSETLSGVGAANDRLVIAAGGRVGVGTSAPTARLDIQAANGDPYWLKVSSPTGDPYFVVIPNGGVGIGTSSPGDNTLYISSGRASAVVASQNNTPAEGASVNMGRARDNGGASGAIVDGDVGGQVGFFGWDDFASADFQPLAMITAHSDGGEGGVGTQQMPGRLGFFTTPSGSVTPVQRLRLDSDGNVGVGTGDPLAPLHLNGAGARMRFDTNATPLTNAGEIRWTGTEFRFHNGSSEQSFGGVWSLNAGDAYYNGGGVGIGTDSTAADLELFSNTGGVSAELVARNNTDTLAPSLSFKRARESAGPAQIQANDAMGVLAFQGRYPAAYADGVQIRAESGEAWSGVAHGAALRILTVANGETTLRERLVISSATGNVGIGTSDPGATLTVFQDQATASLDVITQRDPNTPAKGAQLNLKTSGPGGMPNNVSQGDILARLTGSGYFGTQYSEGAEIQTEAGQGWSGVGQGAALKFLTKLNGETSMSERMVISSATGGIGIGTGGVQSNHLHVYERAAFDVLLDADRTVASATDDATLRFRRSVGNAGAQDRVQSGYDMGSIEWDGYHVTANGYSTGAQILVEASQQWASSQWGTDMRINLIPQNGSVMTPAMIFDTDSGGNGHNIGIGGLTNASARLHVKRNANDSLGMLRLENGDTGATDGDAAITLHTHDGVNQFITFGMDGNDESFRFVRNSDLTGVPQLMLDSSGDVGIGTTNPFADLYVYRNSTGIDAELEVHQAGTGDPILRFSGLTSTSTVDMGLDNSYTGDPFVINYGLGINAASSPGIVLRSNGAVGIGTVPTETLHVYDTGSFGGGLRLESSNTGATANATLAVAVAGTSAGDPRMQFAVPSGQTFTMGVDNSDGDSFKIARNASFAADVDLTIDSAGKVLIGTTTANDTWESALGLKVSRTGPSLNPLLQLKDTSANGGAGIHFQVGSTITDWVVGADSSDSGKFKINTGYQLDAGNVLTITTSGDLGVGTGLPTQRFQVYGGSVTAGGYALNASSTRVVAVGAYDFTGTPTPSYNSTGVSASSSGNMHAVVHGIPNNATITELQCWLNDNDATFNSSMVFREIDQAAGTLTTITTLSTPAGTASWAAYTNTGLNKRVDLDKKWYQLGWSGTCGSNCDVRVCRIRYTVDEL